MDHLELEVHQGVIAIPVNSSEPEHTNVFYDLYTLTFAQTSAKIVLDS